MELSGRMNDLLELGLANDILPVVFSQCIAIEGVDVLFKLVCVNHYFFRSSHLQIVYLFSERRTSSNRALSHFTDDEHLNLCSNGVIKDAGIRNFNRLISLNLCYNRHITDSGISLFSTLCSLNLGANKLITNSGIMTFTKLVTLNLFGNALITDQVLSLFNNLTELNLCTNEVITSFGIKSLTNLCSLNLSYNYSVCNLGLRDLSGLTFLDLDANTNITEDVVRTFTKLSAIHLNNNTNISLPLVWSNMKYLTRISYLNRIFVDGGNSLTGTSLSDFELRLSSKKAAESTPSDQSVSNFTIEAGIWGS